MSEAPKDQTPDALNRALNKAIKEGIEKTVRLKENKAARVKTSSPRGRP